MRRSVARSMVLVGACALGAAGSHLTACSGGAVSGFGDASLDASNTEAASPGLCVDGKPVAWPPGPYGIALTNVLPQGLSFDGPDGPVALQGYFEPCRATSRLLVLRSSAAWCGPCDWHARHSAHLFDAAPLAGRVVLVDLLVADEDNMPATAAAAARYRTRMDAPGPIAADPNYTFGPVLVARSPLPEYVVVDTRTMRIVTVASDPAPEVLAGKLAIELAALDGAPRPDVAPPQVTDEFFTQPQIDMIRAMTGLGAPPPDPTNAYGDQPLAASLGKTLFFDAQLSPSGNVSCATCHEQARAFTDGKPQSVGVARVNRNAPTLAMAAHARWQFWDGRADTLWMQALGPFEDAKEFGSNRLFVAHQVEARYKASYDAVFGAKDPLPDMSDAGRFPAAGKPGDAAWAAMAPADQDAVTRVFVNVGKAIAAFERSLRVQPNALDKYAGGDLGALTRPQKEGLAAFFKVGCAQCHWGPRLTDDAFHVIRFPTGRADQAGDRGRIDVLASLATAEFVASSKWSDAPAQAKNLAFPVAPSMLGAFKTPSLRALPASAPFGHGGSFTTLPEVTRHYAGRGLPPDDPHAVGVTEPWVAQFDPTGQAQIAELLTAFGGDAIVP